MPKDENPDGEARVQGFLILRSEDPDSGDRMERSVWMRWDCARTG